MFLQQNISMDRNLSSGPSGRTGQAIMIMDEKDIMIEILHRLPLKSLLISKCVCRLWNHLISDPIFISNYSRRNPQHHVSGFFLQKFLFLEQYSKLEFITCEGQDDAAPEPSLCFIEDDQGVCIQHSCNGLLLCSSFRCHEDDRKYYICKPTTKQYHQLPKPGCKIVFGINIAYDPTISPHYKIICVCDSNAIKMYDSAIGSWRVSGNHQVFSHVLLFNRGVFLNRALHWISRGALALRFDIEQERMLTMPMPPIPEGRSERRLGYFGESGGHLCLIEIYGPITTCFDVTRMESDYSGWSVRYRVDLSRIASSFPSMVRNNVQDIHRYLFSILHLADRSQVGEDESSMWLHIPGTFISYNLKDGKWSKLRSILHKENKIEEGMGLWHSWEGVHPYTNTLCYF